MHEAGLLYRNERDHLGYGGPI